MLVLGRRLTKFATYSLLEFGQINRAQGVSFGDDWDQIDTSAKSLHDLNIERLQCVSCWADKVKTGVHTEVNLLCTTRLLFLQHVRFMLVVKKFDDRLPRIAIVDIVAKARGINNSQAHCQAMLGSELDSYSAPDTPSPAIIGWLPGCLHEIRWDS